MTADAPLHANHTPLATIPRPIPVASPKATQKLGCPVCERLVHWFHSLTLRTTQPSSTCIVWPSGTIAAIERLPNVIADVVGALEPHREAHKAVLQAAGETFLPRDHCMRHGRGVLDEGLRPPE